MPDQAPSPTGSTSSHDAIRLLQRLLPPDAVIRRRAWDEVLGILKRKGDDE